MEKWNSNFDSEENDARGCQRPMERARAGPGSRGHGGRRHGQSPLTTGRSPAEYPGSNRRGLHQAACFVQSRARATGPERRSADRPALKTSRPVSDVTPVDHRPNAGTRIAPKPARRPVFYSPSVFAHEFCVYTARTSQLTTHRHLPRTLQVLPWLEAMDHTCMRNAQMFGSGPIEPSIVVDNHELKKTQMTYVFCTYVFLKTAYKIEKSYQTNGRNEIQA